MSSTSSDGSKSESAMIEGTGTPRIVSVEILGVSFSIKTDDDPEYIQGLVSELKKRLSDISRQMKIVDPLKLAIITNLLTLDEMHHSKEQKQTVSRDYEASSLLQDIDKRLGELGL